MSVITRIISLLSLNSLDGILLDLFKQIPKSYMYHISGDLNNILTFKYVMDPSPTLVGFAAIGIYSSEKLGRLHQFGMGNNRFRKYWIDLIWVHDSFQKRGLGLQLLKTSEDMIISEMKKDDFAETKRGIYVLALDEAAMFYKKNGYIFITTEDHEDDEDYISVFMEHPYIWMCKPIDENFRPGSVLPPGEEEYFPLLTIDDEFALEWIFKAFSIGYKDYILPTLISEPYLSEFLVNRDELELTKEYYSETLSSFNDSHFESRVLEEFDKALVMQEN